MDEIKIEEWRGVRNLVAAEVIKDDSTGYECGEPFAVAGVAEITKSTESGSESHFYDNKPAVVVDSTGADEVTIAASAIPFDVNAKITGQSYDETKGMFVEGERESKYFALGYITKKTDGTEVFVWRLKGKFSIPNSTHKTEDDGSEANGQELVYTGVNTNHKFAYRGKSEKATNVDTSVNPVKESEFFASVQTPDTVKVTV